MKPLDNQRPATVNADTHPMTQDHIFLSGISVHAQHGALLHEAEVGQLFLIDLDLEISLALPSRTDRIADTVCYSELAQAAILVFKSRKFHLIERAAREVKRYIRRIPHD